jgi:iron complex transport system permease protein
VKAGSILCEKEQFRKKAALNITVIIVLALLIILFFFTALSSGASSVNFADVARMLLSPFFPETEISALRKQVVFSIRLPRALAAIFAGMALSQAGLLMQGVFQNPLVSPYTLGVSNGAAFGASLAIVFRPRFLALAPFLPADYLIPVSAFTFSLLTMALVYMISKIRGHDTKTLILSGVAAGYLFSALVASTRYFSSMRELPELVFWTMGGLSGLPANGIILIGVTTILSMIIMLRYAWDLNALSAGEEPAVSLGVNYKKIKVTSFVLSTLMTSTAVAFTGVIGFVGLIAPHITRMIVGSDYRYAIPASAFMGALLLLVSDTAARVIIAPSELPVGVITSFIGVPFFLYLIIREGR